MRQHKIKFGFVSLICTSSCITIKKPTWMIDPSRMQKKPLS